MEEGLPQSGTKTASPVPRRLHPLPVLIWALKNKTILHGSPAPKAKPWEEDSFQEGKQPSLPDSAVWVPAALQSSLTALEMLGTPSSRHPEASSGPPQLYLRAQSRALGPKGFKNLCTDISKNHCTYGEPTI